MSAMSWTVLALYAVGFCAAIIRIVYANRHDKPCWQSVSVGLACAIFWPIVLMLLVVLWPLSKIAERRSSVRLLRDRNKLLASEKQARAELASKISEALPAITDNQEEISEIIASLDDFVEKSVSKNYSVGIVEDVLVKDTQIDDFDQSYEVALIEFHKKPISETLGSGRIIRYRGVVLFSLSTDASAKLPWAVVMTKRFTKSLTKIDGKLKGKLLNAISEICDDPLTARGDTVKPLTHDFKECWRYRIGDFRLIYIPEKSAHQIVLLSFCPRGNAYA